MSEIMGQALDQANAVIKVLQAEIVELREDLSRFVVDECDAGGHKFAKLDGNQTRCPECLAVGLDELRAQQASAVTSQTVDRELSSSADGRGYSRDDEDWFFSPNDGD